jgi:hypothetical protein
MTQFDRNKSLQELEGHDWGDPNWDSHLVTECYRLHRVPLHDFTVEDLRIMIGQDFSLEYLVPLALEQLSENPLTGGAYYGGDLLVNVLQIGSEFWQEHPAWRDEVAALAGIAISSFSSSSQTATWVQMDAVIKAHEQFKRNTRVA